MYLAVQCTHAYSQNTDLISNLMTKDEGNEIVNPEFIYLTSVNDPETNFPLSLDKKNVL